jgi:4-hydroxy-tetrahydrodipicolinate reductase
MVEQVPIAVMGASGRMGRMLVQAVDDNPACRLCGVTERPGSDWVGRDLGPCLGATERGLIVQDDPLEVFASARAVLDFTTPEATVAHSVLAAQARLVHVIGTTGLSDSDLQQVAAAAHHAVVIRSGNYSLGVNLLTAMVRQAAAALGEDFDIEIVEMHHNRKIDAPSGTALMLGEAAADGRGIALGSLSERGRDGMTGPRRRGAIGFASLRGGSVVGEHDVIFAGQGERLTLSHRADDRLIFARGAVRAALWGQDRKPGAYTMSDVLGL